MSSTFKSLKADFARLGLRQGGVLMVHAGLRAVGPVKGGVNVVVQALLDILGTEGTMVAYVDFEPFFEEDVDQEDVDQEADEDDIPVFDKRIAHAARDQGVLHETLRNWPGALRSDHPDAGVVAIGARAEWITRDHPFQYGYGEGSPFEKVVEAKGQVLMLGAPLDTITLLHYAEHKAQIPDKRIHQYRRLMPTPQGPAWIDFEEFDTCDPVNDLLPTNCFELIANDYLASGKGRLSRVGAASSALFEASDLVPFAVQWLERFFDKLQAPE